MRTSAWSRPGRPGPASVLVGRHSATAAAAGARAGNDVWAVVERGALLPGPLWDQLVQRALPVTRMEVLEASEFSAVIGDQGLGTSEEVLSRPSLPARGRAPRLEELTSSHGPAGAPLGLGPLSGNHRD